MVSDYGVSTEKVGGVDVTIRRIAPGLTIHDLVMVYENAAKNGNEFAGDPSVWPTSLGVLAVTEKILANVEKS